MKFRITLLIMSLTLFFGCKSSQELVTVDKVDLTKYAGQWYEIARLPNSFEKGLKCTSAHYSLNENGTIKVVNQGVSEIDSNKKSEAVGIAKVPDPKQPGRLKVSFFRPFWGKYYIFYLDEDYQNVLVGTPSRKYFWILSRNKQISENELNKLLGIAKKEGFNTEILIFPKQDC